MFEETEPELGSKTVAPDLSVLEHLSEQHDKIVESAYIDRRVPLWGDDGKTPEIYVRFKPVDHKIIRRAMDAADKAKGDRRAAQEMRANIDVLIAGCVGVYGKIPGVDGRFSLRLGDPRGEWTMFDDDLADNLRCGKSATDIIRKLYITDGHILMTASAIAEFSGYIGDEADEAIQGE